MQLSQVIKISKYHGLGNDFLIIDNRDHRYSLCASKLCHRQKGIGADGVILFEDSEIADFKMRVLNSDGGEAEMCGNGLRCLVLHLRENGLPCESIETLSGILEVENDWISLGEPTVTKDIINTGVPHVVLFEPWDEWLGERLCRERSSNINFVTKTDNGLHVQTYERGVGPTLFCGTGGAASAFAYGIWPICVNDEMFYDLRQKKIWMKGPAKHVFNGEINANLL
ncbi:MAG: Diaminopimelate epimerase [Chlamydiia bacterium]|nr:Diaminopimelate epimerase [Chlamydiia bacterium]